MHFYIANACRIDAVFLVDLTLELHLTLDTGCRDPIGCSILIYA